MPPRKPSKPAPDDAFDAEDDREDEPQLDDELDDDSGDDEDDAASEDREQWVDFHDPPDRDAPKPSTPAPRSTPGARPERVERRARSAVDSGMGRPSTGPGVIVPPVAASGSDPATELAPDISAWPGTSDAAKSVGRHTSTIKLWRSQGRVRAIQDASGCWRYNPDDLAENVDTPDQTDPGTVLATGMTAIVQQGANANERLLAMTEIATEGLKDATGVLSEELKRAYARIAELETKLAEAREKLAATHIEDLKHERHMRRLDQRHEMAVTGAKETSARIEGLLTIIGPIAASIGARLIGKEREALAIEAAASGCPVPNDPVSSGAVSSGPVSSGPVSSGPVSSGFAPSPLTLNEGSTFETQMTDAMSRLCAALRAHDGPALQTLRALLPPHVQQALDDIIDGRTDSAVGQGLAVLIGAAQNLSDLQFMTLRPIAPVDVANILAEIRQLIRKQESKP